MSPDAHDARRVYAVVNPIHASARRHVTALLRRRPDAVVLETTRDDPGRDQAERALDAGADLVVVVGGDGTVRQAAGALAGSGVPLAIVPTGTANLFARNLGQRPGGRDPLAGVLDGTPRPLDLGWSRFRRGDQWSDEEPFLVASGIGRDAATVLATRPALKRRLSWLAYFESGLRHAPLPPVGMTVAIDGRPERHLRAWCVLAGNVGRLPGGIAVFPDARCDDGVLDTLVARVERPWQWASVAAKGVLHLRRDVAALEYGRAHDLVVRPDAPQPLHLDGDAVAAVDEVRWRVAASELLVIHPRKRPR